MGEAGTIDTSIMAAARDARELSRAAAERAKPLLVHATHDQHVYRVLHFFLPQDLLNDLPRPHSLVPDEEFLHYYSLKAQQLTLRDILQECGLPE